MGMEQTDRSVMPHVQTKGERTRERVIAQAAQVFNQRGYWGSSLRDLMDATGLEKGGIYNHFAGKDELAAAAFEHNVDLMRARIRAALQGHRHAQDRLRGITDVYRLFVVEPPFVGGCPIMNLAVDSDDTHPMLRAKARRAMAELRDETIARIVARGVERGELRAEVDPQQVAVVFVSMLEGALMLSHLYDDSSQMAVAADHLDRFVADLVVQR
jgi:TetR/AcrR family transcriptional regulator, transcriptional repressor for nem operon